MKNSFVSTTLLSYMQWLDNEILSVGGAYTNTSSQFYYKPDQRLGSSFVAYHSPFKSFVWDSGISGANVITQISGDFGTLSRGESGLIIDYENGRILLPSSFGTNRQISGSYSFKDFNIYFANQSQEEIVFTNKYYLNSRFNRQPTQCPPAYDMATPAIFISTISEKNDNFQFGGVYNSSVLLGVTVLAENLNQLDGALSIISDSEGDNFPQLPQSEWPLNYYGDFKSGVYSYSNLLTSTLPVPRALTGGLTFNSNQTVLLRGTGSPLTIFNTTGLDFNDGDPDDTPIVSTNSIITIASGDFSSLLSASGQIRDLTFAQPAGSAYPTVTSNPFNFYVTSMEARTEAPWLYITGQGYIETTGYSQTSGLFNVNVLSTRFLNQVRSCDFRWQALPTPLPSGPIVPSNYCSPSNLYSITNVEVSKIADGTKLNESLFAGVAYATIKKPRSIHDS
jgi:hypothetical protein